MLLLLPLLLVEYIGILQAALASSASAFVLQLVHFTTVGL
jgi:hypothetical protein